MEEKARFLGVINTAPKTIIFPARAERLMSPEIFT